MSDIERWEGVSTHVCLSTDGWCACPPDLCEGVHLAEEFEALTDAYQGAVEALRDIQQAVRTQSVKARAADYCERRATGALDQLRGR